MPPSRSATLFAAEFARQSGARVVLAVGFRPDQWHGARAFGVVVRSVLRAVDIVIGSIDELNAALLADPRQVEATSSQMSDAHVAGDVARAITSLLSMGPQVVVQKLGSEGARVHLAGGEKIDAPGYPVEIYNILGAGFLYGYVKVWDWPKSARLGNACGAIVVTKQGCANFMPTYDEVMASVNERGGL